MVTYQPQNELFSADTIDHLKQLRDELSTIDSVGSYLKNRPVLIDVSVGPKLIINGQPQSTGVKKS